MWENEVLYKETFKLKPTDQKKSTTQICESLDIFKKVERRGSVIFFTVKKEMKEFQFIISI